MKVVKLIHVLQSENFVDRVHCQWKDEENREEVDQEKGSIASVGIGKTLED